MLGAAVVLLASWLLSTGRAAAMPRCGGAAAPADTHLLAGSGLGAQLALVLSAAPVLLFLTHCWKKGRMTYVCGAMSEEPWPWGAVLAARCAFMAAAAPDVYVEAALLGQILVAYVDASLRPRYPPVRWVHYVYSAAAPGATLWLLYSAGSVYAALSASAAFAAYVGGFLLTMAGALPSQGGTLFVQYLEALVLLGHFGRSHAASCSGC